MGLGQYLKFPAPSQVPDILAQNSNRLKRVRSNFFWESRSPPCPFLWTN